jgi:hypothetical protein
MQTTQLRQRIGVVVGADIQIRVRIVRGDLQPGGLLSVFVAAGSFAGFHRAQKAFGHRSGSRLIRLRRGADDRLPASMLATETFSAAT